jgi:hypothetical protein
MKRIQALFVSALIADLPLVLRYPRKRLLLFESLMRPGRVVEADELGHEVSEMLLAEDKHVVEELALGRLHHDYRRAA